MPYDGHPFGNALEIIPCGLQPAAPFEPFAACRQGGFHEILAPEDALVSQGPVTRVAPGLNGFPPSQAADKPATGKLEPPAPPGLFPDEFPVPPRTQLLGHLGRHGLWLISSCL